VLFQKPRHDADEYAEFTQRRGTGKNGFDFFENDCKRRVFGP
jgi:hypothetical protein